MNKKHDFTIKCMSDSNLFDYSKAIVIDTFWWILGKGIAFAQNVKTKRRQAKAMQWWV